MKQPKGVFRTALAAALALGASHAHAVVTFDAMGGELEVEGSLTSIVRAHVGSGDMYLGQWIQRSHLVRTSEPRAPAQADGIAAFWGVTAKRSH